MEMVTKTYKGDDVHLYVEESTVSNSQIDGTCAVNVMFNSKVDKCEITAYDKTITISGSEVTRSRRVWNNSEVLLSAFKGVL